MGEEEDSLGEVQRSGLSAEASRETSDETSSPDTKTLVKPQALMKP